VTPKTSDGHKGRVIAKRNKIKERVMRLADIIGLQTSEKDAKSCGMKEIIGS
jgi:hypothetical protein